MQTVVVSRRPTSIVRYFTRKRPKPMLIIQSCSPKLLCVLGTVSVSGILCLPCGVPCVCVIKQRCNSLYASTRQNKEMARQGLNARYRPWLFSEARGREARSLISRHLSLAILWFSPSLLWQVPSNIANTGLSLGTARTLSTATPFLYCGTAIVFDWLSRHLPKALALAVSWCIRRYRRYKDPYIDFTLWLKSRSLGLAKGRIC